MILPMESCPSCGGPDVALMPWVTTRPCVLGTALIVAGQTVAHMGPGEKIVLGGELIQRARDEDPFGEAGTGVAA